MVSRTCVKAAAISAILALSCESQSVPPDDTEPPRALTASESRLVSGTLTFGLDLFAQVLAEQPDRNVIVSPLSVALALGMTANGASGETLEAIRNALGHPDLSDSVINRSFADLMSLLTRLDSAVQLEIANSVWYRDDFAVKSSFLETNREQFDARIAGLDFSDPQASQTINNWVSEATGGKIEQIVPDQIDPMIMLYLINAVYFNGTWTTEFDPDQTADAPFRTTGGEVTARMMTLDQRLAYAETTDYQAVELPYGNGYYRLIAVLPREGRSVDSLARSFSADSWNKLISSLQIRPGTLFLPKFELEFQTALHSALSAMGMDIAFSPERAEFDRIADRDDLHISEVLHKTYIKLDERGTEAAAATSVGIGITSVGPEKFTIRFDRPFLFAIRESHSGTIIFLGLIANPSAA